jgi:intermediate peptidase
MLRTFAVNKFSAYFAHSRKLNTISNSVFSQLGATFNQKPSSTQQQNQPRIKDSFNSLTKYLPFAANVSKLKSVLGSEKSGGLFGNKELVTFDGFHALKERAEKNVNTLIKEAFREDSSLPRRKMVEIFDDISNELCCVADMAEFVRTSHPDVHFRQAANLTFGSISQIVEKLNTNYKLYCKLKESLHVDQGMDDCDRRVCKLFLVDFEQSGIHLDEASRENFVAINDQLVHILMKFQVNSQAPSEVNSNQIDSKFAEMYV